MILEGFMKLSFNLILTQYVTMKVTLKITIYVEYITTKTTMPCKDQFHSNKYLSQLLVNLLAKI